MFWIIENENQINKFLSKKYQEALIEIIPYNYNTHPATNSISLIYIRPINSYKGYIISVNHSESLSICDDSVLKILNSFSKIYVRDKKEFIHYYILNNIYDITFPFNYEYKLTPTHKFYYSLYPNLPHINCIIPISKHYEYCEWIYNELKSNINKPINEFYNNIAPIVFNAIERNGIHIHKDNFQKYFYNIESEFTYTQYNFKTTTTRPSNTFGGINYAALNKENGCRKSFIPKNNQFIEIDISAYHPQLAANLINYSFPTNDIHEYLASLYNVDYNKSKELTFKQLYGGVFESYKNLEFFKNINTFIYNLWEQFEKNGYIEVPISKHIIEKKNVKEMNPQKLFNYLLQALETAHHVSILWEVLKYLRGKNTKIVLYVYDAILLDVDENENVVEYIKSIYCNHGVNIKIKTGNNYNNLI
jgi:hypothetical protein